MFIIQVDWSTTVAKVVETLNTTHAVGDVINATQDAKLTSISHKLIDQSEWLAFVNYNYPLNKYDSIILKMRTLNI